MRRLEGWMGLDEEGGGWMGGGGGSWRWVAGGAVGVGGAGG